MLVSSHIQTLFDAGGPFVGPEGAPASRLTVELGWTLRTSSGAVGTFDSNKLPIRYFQSDPLTETELPNLKSVDTQTSVDSDAGSATFVLYNAAMTTVVGEPVGNVGYYTAGRGSAGNRWGHVANDWAGVLVPNALLRCVDIETEILTKRGWLRWDEVRVGDETLGIDPDRDIACWQTIEEVFTKDVCTDLIAMKGDVHDSLTTGDHRWLTRTRAGRWAWKTTETLSSDSSIPLAWPVELPTTPVLSDDLVELAAWYYTEGSHDHRLRTLDASIKISQSSTKNPTNVERIRLAAKRLFGEPGPLQRGVVVSQERVDAVLHLRSQGISGRQIARALGESRHSVQRWLNGTRSTFKSTHKWRERLNTDGMIEFVFAREVAREIKALVSGPDKVPTNGFLASLTQYQLDLFLEVCILADGSISCGQTSFVQKNCGRISAFQMACALAGKPAHTTSIALADTTRTTLLKRRVVRPVSARHQAMRKPSPSARSMTIRKERYDGVVWCPRVKHHNWLARRNGSIYYTGNTYQGMGGQDKTLAQAIADGNVVQTGTWLVDDVRVDTSGVITLQCRDMAKLAIDQEIYPPLLPTTFYPPLFARFFHTFDEHITRIPYGVTASGTRLILGMEVNLDGDGYWLVGDDSGVFTFGYNFFYGSLGGLYSHEVIGMARTPSSEGYWLGGVDGAVFAFGDATYHGGATSSNPFVAIEKMGGDGYYLMDTHGGVYAKGAATYHGGSPSGHTDIVGMAVMPDGTGYWLAAADGSIFAYGTAVYHGGVTVPAGTTVTAIASTPTGLGYYAVTKKGHVFAFGDGTYRGGTDTIVLNDPICDVDVAPNGHGYWLVAEDGGVFTFGGAPPDDNIFFYGSLPGDTNMDLPTDGNISDTSDIVKFLLLWAGWWLYPHYTGAWPDVFGSIETTGIYPVEDLQPDFFIRQPVMTVLTKLKESVGYLLRTLEDGGFSFASPNYWGPGNFLADGTHTSYIPVIDERVNLTQYGTSTNDKDLRSQITISSEEPTDGIEGTVTTTVVPPSADRLKGIVKTAGWVNENFTSADEQQVMAELIAIQIWFQQRVSSSTCAFNPLVCVDDQIRVYEEQSEEEFIHYVRGVQHTHDLESGQASTTLTHHWLGSEDSWSVVMPT